MERMNEIILFETDDKAITLSVTVEEETVWLNRNQERFYGHNLGGTVLPRLICL